MTARPTTSPDALAALRFPDFRLFLAAGVGSNLAYRALAVVIGFQVYQLTHSTLALGALGLVEAAPALGLALIGGYFADRLDRRRILLITRLLQLLAALVMALLSGLGAVHLGALYVLVFISGLARGFGDPASSAFETQMVPTSAFVNAATWLGSATQAAAMLGPALGGLVYGFAGARGAYFMIAALQLLALLGVLFIRPRPTPPVQTREPIGQSIRAGLDFVRRDQVLLGSMALDLFAVLFGGAVALLPVFASTILHVGAQGLGLLVAAPSVGGLLVTLIATRRPITQNAGRILLACVAGFGISIIVFALSHSLWLSLAMLALSGFFDGVSVVVRRAVLRLRTPNELRGRVGAVSLLFIGSSNEIGAAESGYTAHLFGTARSVWLGGVLTLVVVALAAWKIPQLRELNLGAKTAEEKEPGQLAQDIAKHEGEIG